MALNHDRTRAPIGIFDSGVGGLTVFQEVQRHLPHEDLIYLGDTARAPYGSKAGETVTRFSLECVRHLMGYGIKALVVACNTASSWALTSLRRRYKIPMLGVIQPGAHAALTLTAGQGPVGVIGTRATVRSEAYPKSIRALAPRAQVVSQACPLLVPLVEEGWLRGPITEQIVRLYLAPLLKRRISSLILGCTHYPALKPVLSRVCGPRVRIIDSAEEVAKGLTVILEQTGLASPRHARGKQNFLVTDVPDQFVRVGTAILGRPLRSVKRVSVQGD